MSELICLGDSITDCNRLFEDYPLGNGYVRLLARKISQDSEIRNYGVDGFTVARVLENVSCSRIPLSSSSVVTLLIGINDIGLMMNTDRTEEQKQKMMQNFFIHYDQLLKLLLQSIFPERSNIAHGSIILMEPFIFPHPDQYRLWIPYVKAMSDGIARLAEKYQLPYILLHDFFNSIAAQKGYDAITTDGIHLTFFGHELLADRLYPCISI